MLIVGPVAAADRQPVELSGKTPDVDIKIELASLKPGEKLAEVLSDDGEEVRPCVEGIMELQWLRNTSIDLTDILTLVEQARPANDLPAGSVVNMADRIRSGHAAELRVTKR